MATILKRKKKYSVVYYYEDEKGEKKQKWETYNTHAEAKKRKIEVVRECLDIFAFFIRYFLYLHFKCYPLSWFPL